MSDNKSSPAARDIAFDASLRPATFREFVGQQAICQRLKSMIQAAQDRGDVVEHMLLTGPSGLGKTTLAHIVAQAVGANIRSASGPTIEVLGDLAGLLTVSERGDVLFIDEIDRLAPEFAEYLFAAMKDFKLDIVIDEGPNARSIPLSLSRFTLIGATTRVEMLSPRLRSLFGVSYEFGYYTPEELQTIVLRSAGIINVPLDPPGALEIATQAQSTPRIANNLLRLAAPRLRLKSSIGHADWRGALQVLTRELWALAEARPDFEELPSWIAKACASGVLSEDTDGIEQVHTILRSVVNRYGDDEDRTCFARMRSRAAEVRPEEMALGAADLTQQAATFREGVQRLPLAIMGEQLFIGRHTRISFNRTLRIPEDGRDYPLPAGFGRLPIARVEDYAERVPEKWLEQGGFIIPLYQREALFLEFAGANWRPTIAKVSVGRVNAISGKPHDLKIREHRQDYVVIPDQRWLDGINAGDGSVRQFVAMPLGKGYTIEAQVTDEEQHGGFQLAIFDPRRGRFPESDPEQAKLAAAARAERSRRAAEDDRSVPLHARRGLPLYSRSRGSFMPAEDEMGIAAGGRIKQQILEDSYGVESWDESIFRDVVIHIVNSAVYKQITGIEAPPSPITAEQYQHYKIPWYSDYAEKTPALGPVAAFKRILSVGQIDKNRGVKVDEFPARRVQPEEIVLIHTQTLEERWEALVERATLSAQNGYHRIAVREASQALDLTAQHPRPFLIRAVSNHRLGLHADAEADASACLKLQPGNVWALSIRAYASLALGEALLAKEDAEKLLASQPDDDDGLYVRAEANLLLKYYEDALSDAEKMLHKDASDEDAIRIKKEASTKLFYRS